jgi:hypothetical protein
LSADNKETPKMTKKNDECPYCAAPKTNRGRLQHFGKYSGYACRSWVADAGQSNRSDVCKSRQSFNKLAAASCVPEVQSARA